ncbi:MAG TPA: TadE/TadG family type IV pilus assembly protein [Acidimicrobiales bacterium]|nr:TadE/TadG family type IV pilus assembly protein [Acidimicrobiales bacterium]
MSPSRRRGPGTDIPGPRRRLIRRNRGQAVVELALVIPFVVVLLLAVVQLGLVVRDHILVVHASREAARVGAVDPDPDAPRRAAVAATELSEDRMRVETESRGGPGSTLTVTIRYDSPTEVPLVGAFLPDVRLRAVASIRVEV